jgi:hypothetical protein
MFQWQADFFADFARDQLVVTREHFDLDAVLLESGDSRCGCLLRRVEERDVTFQDKIMFIILTIRGLRFYVPVGDG